MESKILKTIKKTVATVDGATFVEVLEDRGAARLVFQDKDGEKHFLSLNLANRNSPFWEKSLAAKVRGRLRGTL